MSRIKLTGNHLTEIGYKSGPIFGLILSEFPRDYKHASIEDAKVMLKDVLDNTDAYLGFKDVLGKIARKLRPPIKKEAEVLKLKEGGVEVAFFGKDNIEEGALNQIYLASKLPIAKKAAVMPDGHQGYGLPIGGVLATENAIIPYGVGVDIGCRMALTLYDHPASIIDGQKDKLKNALGKHTVFGTGQASENPLDDPVLDNSLFNDIKLLKGLKDHAARQIGSSGSGNHFVEFGIVEVYPDSKLGIAEKTYVAILSHSGSRYLGANIAKHYTSIAKSQSRLTHEAINLSWLDMASQEGWEYWLSMNLAGDYAKACHDHIHKKLAKELGWKAVIKIENHHNFAWKEKLEDGTDVIVHRKGATPAGEGVLGIIPGSMATPGFVVRGRGNASSLNSASHGAGRAMSRRKANEKYSKSDVKAICKRNNVELIGGGNDEIPFAYKDIHTVMNDQVDLVDKVAIFYPRIVRMAN